MKRLFQQLDISSFASSAIINGLVLLVFQFIKMPEEQAEAGFVVESIQPEERLVEEFNQEIEVETKEATTLSKVSGGVVAAKAGASTLKTVTKVNVNQSRSLQPMAVNVNTSVSALPTDGELAMDLGEGEVTGDVGAVVDGYGTALGRVAEELVRLMRKQKVLVVWLFDESESMKDDQAEIRERFHKVYADLGLAVETDPTLKKRSKQASQAPLMTVIGSYGQGLKFHTKLPTNDLATIKAAIDQIQVDESGKENMCLSIRETIKNSKVGASRQKRKLVIVVVSDESGDDGAMVDLAIAEAKNAASPIYILGRESVFGYPYARQRWKDPKYNLTHWLRINRGAESAFPECLQWDGLRNRYDAFNAGQGPYEMVRLARESGGIFFVLPGEEEDLSGPGANDRRKFDFLAMKEYRPLLLPRDAYVRDLQKNPFRKTVMDVVVRLNPTENKLLFPVHDPQLNIREHHYPLTQAEFQKEATAQVGKAARAMMLLNQAVPMLETVKQLRPQEGSQRWRANYDLALAQLYAYRVRLFQFLLAMDKHAYATPRPKQPKTNEWNVRRTATMLIPDDTQFSRLKQAFKIETSKDEYLQLLDSQRLKAIELFDYVISEHPGTPWARRAEYERDHGFGMQFVEGFHDPNYNRRDIKLPTL